MLFKSSEVKVNVCDVFYLTIATSTTVRSIISTLAGPAATGLGDAILMIPARSPRWYPGQASWRSCVDVQYITPAPGAA